MPRTGRRRVGDGRRVQARRRTDFYYSLGKLAGLIACVCTAIIGQAELIGEPWRHYVTVTAVIATAIWAYGIHPTTFALLRKSWKGR